MHKIIAPIWEQTADGHRDLGKHEFVQLPAPGDLVQICGPAGALDFMRVVHVEHHPRPVPPDIVDAPPDAIIVVTFAGREGVLGD